MVQAPSIFRGSFKLAETFILILEMSLLVSSAYGSSIISPDVPSEEMTEFPCHDLEPALQRLKKIPEHLHPEALQTGICRVRGGNNHANQVWQCPTNAHENSNFQHRSDFHLGLYCEDVELLFSLYNRDEMKGHPGNFSGFDYQSWCKCRPNNSVERDTCDLCSDGMELKPSVMNRVFNDAASDERLRLTCVEASEYAKHIKEKRRCNDTLDKARAFCCQASSKNSPHKLEFEDVQMTMAIIVAVTTFSGLLVFALLKMMEGIDHYFFSGKMCEDTVKDTLYYRR